MHVSMCECARSRGAIGQLFWEGELTVTVIAEEDKLIGPLGHNAESIF